MQLLELNKQTLIDLWQPKAGLNNHLQIESLTHTHPHMSRLLMKSAIHSCLIEFNCNTVITSISQRITFKIALIIFDCSHGRCPKYFSDVYIPVHTVTAHSLLRSANHDDLVVPPVLSCFGCRSCRVSGPTIWNDLPVDIRSTDITHEQFKRSLKIWLFECVCTVEGTSEKQSSLKARLRNGLT